MASAIEISLLAETRGIREGIRQTTDELGKLDRSARSMGPTLKGMLAADLIAAGVGALASAGRDAIATVQEQQKLAAQTSAVLASTGNAANVSAAQVKKLSDAIEANSMIDAEAITAGQNLLLTFTGVQNRAGKGNDIFNQTTQIMADMATAMGSSPKTAAMQLGKALNDPVKGVTALSRVGVTFTDEQKRMIASMQEAGDTAGAQKVILAELRKEFGGSAAASADTFAGRLFSLKDTLSGVGEEIVTGALPYAEKLAAWAADTLPGAIDDAKAALDQLAPVFRPIIDAGKALLDALGGGGGGAQLAELGATIKKVLSTVAPIIGSLVGAVSGAITTMMPTILAAGRDIMSTVSNVAKIIRVVWQQIAPVVLPIVKLVFQTIIRVVGGALKIVSGVIKVFASVLTGDWRGAWDGIKKIVSGAVAMVGAVVKLLVGLVRLQFLRMKVGALRAWAALKAGISRAIDGARAAVKGKLDAIGRALRGAWSSATGATRAAWRALVGAIRDQISAVVTKVRGIKGRILAVLTGARSWLSAAGGRIIAGLVSGISGSIRNVIDEAKRVARAAVDAAKAALGIKSPSREFAQLGAQVTAGLVAGLDQTQAARGAARLAGALVAGFGVPELGAAYGAGAGRAPVIVVERLNVDVARGVSPAEVGRELVGYLRAYERTQGRR